MIVQFLLFVLAQALVINGIKESMSEGMILEKPAAWIKSKVGEFWFKPIGSCIKCMASTWGTITFWPFALVVFGWHWQELPIFVADIFSVSIVSWLIYKKL